MNDLGIYNELPRVAENLAERFKNVRVMVVGDVMLDEYILGSVTRISPEAPVPVLDVQSKSHVLGGAGNVAANIAALGSEAVVVGFAAKDAAGEQIRELFAALNISSAGLVDSGSRCTIQKTRIVAGQQQLVRIDQEIRKPASAAILDAAYQTIQDLIGSVHVVILSDYAKGLLTDDLCEKAIRVARQRNAPVIVDPKTRDFRKYRGCTVITPNLSEAALAAGITIDSEAALTEAGRRLLETLPSTNVLVTRGSDGMTLFRQGHQPLTVPTVARQVFDVVGAGDTVIATVAISLAANLPLEVAMKIANVAAGIVVEKHGTATVSVDEITSHSTISDACSLF